MSTKIYTAYKVKDSSKLWSILKDIKKKCQKNIKIKLSEIFTNTVANVNPNSIMYKNLIKEGFSDEEVRRTIADKTIRRLYRISSYSIYRSEYNFDVNIAIREYDGDYYLIPHCDMYMSRVLDFLRRDKRLQDFHYQNQCERPNNITKKEWKHREEIWDEIDKNGWDNYLLLEICSWENFYTLNPRYNKP